MDNTEIQSLLTDALSLDEVHVKSDGSHYEIIAVGACFEGMRSVKRQQTVYGPLMATIAAGDMHAVSIKAFTVDEWQRERKLMMPS
ncbi:MULTISPECIES: BolA family iron metabolism protein IbaG [Corallincola]|uniref:BolA family transcriptional regulator n=3 Tax=Corallincola TaxID=1775176 RepID=A0A368NIC4_9GAMM|nr:MULTISPECIES: BolA family iron metabolism protein IbaG [Corallincola]RCU49860.1 BolA family transcriptional regulator [Corallincola holothuriorum]TAA45161.1 BolA family transcriptional regulator [Corallincola spongiicola]TCI03562.1 BolA family transcriptional regulator [Corallincola luteus]